MNASSATAAFGVRLTDASGVPGNASRGGVSFVAP